MRLAVVSSVAMPPSSVPKASGISTRDSRTPAARAAPTAAGSRTATTAMLFIPSESRAAAVKKSSAMRRSLPPLTRSSERATRSTTPVRSSAPVITKSAAIVTTAGLLKPARIWGSGTMRASASAASTESATTSARTRLASSASTAPVRMTSRARSLPVSWGMGSAAPR